VLVTKLEQHNTFAEAMRGVRSAFLFGARDKAKQVIVVTSAVPGDGKTTITVNFATTLARAGHKVLLVDSDLRRGNVHQYFGLKRDTGFTEVLIGRSHWEDVVRQTPVESLHLITTGSLPGNPGELLISPITEQFLAEARQQYDYVLFDCPPLTSIDDTFCLLSLVDGLLFVVKAGHTSMRFAKNALANVRHRGSPILGIVLNGITTDHPGYYYYYYYHDYYKTAQDAAKKGEILPESQPGVKMAPKRGSSGTVNGVAHTPGSGSPASAEESQKAALFKARRAAQKGDTQPPENPPPSAPNDPPPSAA
jgi:capsular exopolysaccharide synthesis family protein